MFKELPSQAELLRVFTYDPHTGDLRWVRRNQRRAASKESNGYLQVKYLGSNYAVHRVIWMMVHGEMPRHLEIDHINKDRTDNRLSNLRLASVSENRCNTTARRGRDLPKGVIRDKRKFCARIQKDGVCHRLGNFPTPEEAHSAYVNAAKHLHGSFASAN